jgi:hypothetical protein
MQEQDPTLAGLVIAFVILFVVFRMLERMLEVETPVPAGLIGQMLFPFRKARCKVPHRELEGVGHETEAPPSPPLRAYIARLSLITSAKSPFGNCLTLPPFTTCISTACTPRSASPSAK